VTERQGYEGCISHTDESTRTLQLTQALYDNYTSILTTSSALVKAIERADWYDRLLIFSAFFLFMLVVGWVIKRRVLDKVMGGFGWWLAGSWKLVRMGVGRPVKNGAEVVAAVSSLSGAAASAVGTATAVPSLSRLATRPSAVDVPPDERASTGSDILDSVVPLDSPAASSAAAIPEQAERTTRDEL